MRREKRSVPKRQSLQSNTAAPDESAESFPNGIHSLVPEGTKLTAKQNTTMAGASAKYSDSVKRKTPKPMCQSELSTRRSLPCKRRESRGERMPLKWANMSATGGGRWENVPRITLTFGRTSVNASLVLQDVWKLQLGSCEGSVRPNDFEPIGSPLSETTCGVFHELSTILEGCGGPRLLDFPAVFTMLTPRVRRIGQASRRRDTRSAE
jgi:hypothetical protein